MSRGASLVGLLDAVCDRETFLAFVRALAADRLDDVRAHEAAPASPDGSGDWQNVTIEDFLESAASWADDVGKTGDERAAWFPEAPSWAAFASFLYAGKIYE